MYSVAVKGFGGSCSESSVEFQVTVFLSQGLSSFLWVNEEVPLPSPFSCLQIHLFFSYKESSFVALVESRKAKCNVPDCLPQKPLFVQNTVTLEDSFCEKLSGKLNMLH